MTFGRSPGDRAVDDGGFMPRLDQPSFDRPYADARHDGFGGAPLVQLRGDAAHDVAAPPSLVQDAAARGTEGAGVGLPHLDAIQTSFGHHDVSGIRAHTDGAAADACATIGAQGFATGPHVAFGGTPDLHTAAHEAAHVVQQRGGVQLKGGVGEASDPHERHADEVADRVVQGRSAVDLLDRYGGGGADLGAGGVQLKIGEGKPVLTRVRHATKGLGTIIEIVDHGNYKVRWDDKELGEEIIGRNKPAYHLDQPSVDLPSAPPLPNNLARQLPPNLLAGMLQIGTPSSTDEVKAESPQRVEPEAPQTAQVIEQQLPEQQLTRGEAHQVVPQVIDAPREQQGQVVEVPTPQTPEVGHTAPGQTAQLVEQPRVQEPEVVPSSVQDPKGEPPKHEPVPVTAKVVEPLKLETATLVDATPPRTVVEQHPVTRQVIDAPKEQSGQIFEAPKPQVAQLVEPPSGQTAQLVETPKVEQPHVEQPHVEQPTIEQPTIEQPRGVTPQPQEPEKPPPLTIDSIMKSEAWLKTRKDALPLGYKLNKKEQGLNVKNLRGCKTNQQNLRAFQGKLDVLHQKLEALREKERKEELKREEERKKEAEERREREEKSQREEHEREERKKQKRRQQRGTLATKLLNLQPELMQRQETLRDDLRDLARDQTQFEDQLRERDSDLRDTHRSQNSNHEGVRNEQVEQQRELSCWSDSSLRDLDQRRQALEERARHLEGEIRDLEKIEVQITLLDKKNEDLVDPNDPTEVNSREIRGNSATARTDLQDREESQQRLVDLGASRYTHLPTFVVDSVVHGQPRDAESILERMNKLVAGAPGTISWAKRNDLQDPRGATFYTPEYLGGYHLFFELIADWFNWRGKGASHGFSLQHIALARNQVTNSREEYVSADVPVEGVKYRICVDISRRRIVTMYTI